jgi:aryl-alcohol dehydrogenase-like predicted oxidoreductase
MPFPRSDRVRGRGPGPRHHEIAALRLGIELGMNLIDPAEMYVHSRAEELLGEAIEGAATG